MTVEFDGIDAEGIKNQAKRDWDNTPDIRMEFGGDFECYYHFRLAEARGLFRIQGSIDRHR